MSFTDIKLYGVATVYNVADIIPYAMAYHEKMGYDKFVIYDDGSTDNTIELLSKYPFVEIRKLDSSNSFDDVQRMNAMFEFYSEIKNSNINFNNTHVWFNFCDFDEVVYYTHYTNSFTFKHYLWLLSDIGYNVMCEDIIDIFSPLKEITPDTLVHTQMSRGCYGTPFGWNKPSCFRVNDMEHFFYQYGFHSWVYHFKNGIEFKPIINTRYVFRFHLKFILGKEHLYKLYQDYVKRENPNYAANMGDIITLYKENDERSFSLQKYIENKIINGYNDISYISSGKILWS